MNRTEFMDLLRYYFRHVSEADLADILSDYDAHFEEGLKSGLSEEEICKELGSPKAVYEMYLHEGMITEKSGEKQSADAAEKLADTAGKVAEGAGAIATKAKKAWDTSISPQLPEAASTASSIVLKILTAACYTLSFLIIAFTALVVYLLSTVFPAPGGFPLMPGMPPLPPLPGLSSLTLMGIGGTGFFAGLALFFTGRELQQYRKTRETPPAGGASGDAAGGNAAPTKEESPSHPSFPAAANAQPAAAEK